MKRYGLLGKTLGHSHSPKIHTLLYGYDYELLPMEEEAVAPFLQARAFDGINVTIPYKQTVMPHLDALTETAKRIGAVNTIVKRPDGTLLGDNTDAYGFAFMAEQNGMVFEGQKVVILGSGGTSLMVQDVVKQAGGEAVVISRSGNNHYGNLSLHADATYLVYTTPVGMYPDIDGCPVDLSVFPKLQGVLDVIYNPIRTMLVQSAMDKGIPCVSGMMMLVAQASRAGEAFTGEQGSKERILQVTQTMSQSQKNVVLIGMPGCGKSTVGKCVAQKLKMPLVDIDAEIVKKAGKSIPDIFKDEGEEAFRLMESEVIASISTKTGQVIACGGGAVLRKDNRRHLRMNATVFYLKRALSSLATKGRPLSTDAKALEAMYQKRDPLYQLCADVVVDNNQEMQHSVETIKQHFLQA